MAPFGGSREHVGRPLPEIRLEEDRRSVMLRVRRLSLLISLLAFIALVLMIVQTIR